MTSAVVVWVRKMDTFEAVKAQMDSIAEHRPDEPTEFDGIVDLHWRFNSFAKAERLANALRETVSQKPEIVVLCLSRYDDITASVTLQERCRDETLICRGARHDIVNNA